MVYGACALDLTACDFYLWDNTKSPQKQSPHREKHLKKSKSAMGARVPSQG
jgi:hypothetical protein